MDERRRERESAKTKSASSSSDEEHFLFYFLDGGEVWTGFQIGGRIRKKGLNKIIPSQRTGPVKKKNPIPTPKSQVNLQPANAHTNVNTPPHPTTSLKPHQPKPKVFLYNLLYYLHVLSLSQLNILRTANEQDRQSSLSAQPILNII